MRILIIKMTSMGDIIHAFPALSDIVLNYPDAQIDWVVEDIFAEMLHWHPGVGRIIPVAMRRWRKGIVKARAEIKAFIASLRQQQYDIVIDLQGLLKSAILTRLVKAKRYIGLDNSLLREKVAGHFYSEQYTSSATHIIHQTKQVVAQALGYEVSTALNFGLQFHAEPYMTHPYVMCIHSTTWITKHWPAEHWQSLIAHLTRQGLFVLLPWSSAVEKARADNLAVSDKVIVLPKSSLTTLAKWAKAAQYCVSVDTGLGHIIAASGVPTSMVFGPTDAKRLGILGDHQENLVPGLSCAPCGQKQCQAQDKQGNPSCYQQVLPEQVINKMSAYISNRSIIAS